jgi:hypothetical protein
MDQPLCPTLACIQLEAPHFEQTSHHDLRAPHRCDYLLLLRSAAARPLREGTVAPHSSEIQMILLSLHSAP